MVDANLKIIEELKIFLDTVADNPDIKKLFTASPADFTRERKLPLKKLIGLLINLPKRSLSIELQSFFENIGEEGACCTKGAFSLQRIKLKPMLFRVWNHFLVQSFYRNYGQGAGLWEGFRLLAVDGSDICVPDVPSVVDHFGSAGNQFGGVPMARAVQVHDVLNDLTVWGGIFPMAESENAIIAKNISHLPAGSLTLFDRGYPSYSLMYLLANEEEPKHFLMRCRANFSNDVKAFVKSSKMDLTTVIYPSLESIGRLRENGYIVTKGTPLRVRMLKVALPGGETEVLLTNLFDVQRFAYQKLAKLYFFRWKIETAYGKQKNQMQMEIFSGHRVICIEQDYVAGLFVANLQSIIEKQCGPELQKVSSCRAHVYKVNKNTSWAFMKGRVIKLFVQENDSLKILMELQGLFIKNIEPVRQERHTKRRPVKRKRGKYQTFTNYRRAI